MNAPMTGNVERVFAQFLELERQTRAAHSTEQLAYSLVNDGQPLFGYRHAALLIAGKVRAVTAVSSIDPNAPFVAFVEQAVAQLHKQAGPDRAGHPPEQLSARCRPTGAGLSAAQVFWLPLIDPQGRVFGGLWLARDTAWNPAEQVLLAQLGDTYSHAWRALQPRQPWRLRLTRKRQVLVVVALLLVVDPGAPIGIGAR
jgi:hypothetical protein